MKKKIFSLFATICLMLSVFLVTPITASAASASESTADEAIAYVASLLGKSIDYDGAAGYQCVDLVKQYYAHFGHTTNVYGNAKDYTSNTIPAGWTRIQGAAPQKGDVLVYTGGTYGHVCIYESDYVTYHQNYGYSYVTKSSTYYRNIKDGTYWGVIRPNFRTGYSLDPATYATVNNGTLSFKNAGSGYIMNYGHGWQGLSYTPMIMSNLDGSPEQAFIVEHQGDGQYTFRTKYDTNLALNVWTSGNAASGHKVCGYAYSGSNTQRFYITPVGDGKYVLQSVSNPNVCVATPSGDWHAQLEMQTYTGDEKQKWYILGAEIWATGISLNQSDASVKKGETVQLSATVTPSDTTNQSVTWSSSNTSVATVNSNGLVTAVGAGSATITATASGGNSVSASCAVTVTNPIKSAPAMSGVKIAGTASDALRIGWTAKSTASGYILEQYKDGSWKQIAKITNNATTSYRVSGLKSATTYRFRIRSYVMNGSTPSYGTYTTVSGTTAKKTATVVSGLSIGGRATNALRLNWTKNSTAGGYIIEQYKSGTWTRIAKLTSNATTTYRVSGLKAGTTYKFRIKTYVMNGSAASYSTYKTISAKTLPTSVSNLVIGGKAKDALRLNWSKNTSAQGYIIEKQVGSKWSRVAKVTSNATTTYRVTGLSSGKTYNFRVRTYTMDGSTPLYGSYVYVNGTTK